MVELINIYISQGWDIKCAVCSNTNNLQVHHKDYMEAGKEDLSQKASEEGRGIWQLQFLCGHCHTKTHFDKKWLEETKIKQSKAVSEIIREMLAKNVC